MFSACVELCIHVVLKTQEFDDLLQSSKAEQFVLNEILDTIGRDLIGNNVHFLNVTSQLELAVPLFHFS